MNSENLVSLADLTTERQREIASQGGKASARKRKEKKLMKETVEAVMSMPIGRGNAETVEAVMSMPIGRGNAETVEAVMSIADAKGANLTVKEAIVIAQAVKAMKGDTRAAEFLRDTMGEKPSLDIALGVEDIDYQMDRLDELVAQMNEPIGERVIQIPEQSISHLDRVQSFNPNLDSEVRLTRILKIEAVKEYYNAKWTMFFYGCDIRVTEQDGLLIIPSEVLMSSTSGTCALAEDLNDSERNRRVFTWTLAD